MSNLLRLIGRRLIALPIMIFGVTILVFFIMHSLLSTKRIRSLARTPLKPKPSSIARSTD